MKQKIIFGLYVLFFIAMVVFLLLFVRGDKPVEESTMSALVTLHPETTITTEATTATESSETTETTVEQATETVVAETTTTEIATETSSTTSRAETTISTLETTTESTTTPTMAKTALTKSNYEVAQEVWQGKWGAGEERKQRLTDAGYDYNAVQEQVCLIRGTTTTTTTPKVQSSTTASTTTPVAAQGNSKGSFIKTFNRGTYYCYGYECKGGSDRQLIDCSIGTNEVKGSIASSYLYKNYGYNYNNSRTKVYLEIPDYPQMNGYYYLDDSDAGNPEVIDFFYIYASNCPFQYQGIVKVNAYLP